MKRGAVRASLKALAVGATCLAASGCTLPVSKQALWSPLERTPSPHATFVTEEDSGLALFGLITLSEPDHYAVLLERARRRNKCTRLHHAQLDYFQDYWIIVAFPVARLTVLCDRPPPQLIEQLPKTPPP